MFQPINNKSCP